MAEKDVFREAVETCGTTVKKGEEECVSWKDVHGGCSGCPFQLGCIKMSFILVASISDANLEDVFNVTEEILVAKTLEEVYQIRILETVLYCSCPCP